jgi:hypothetical protein
MMSDPVGLCTSWCVYLSTARVPFFNPVVFRTFPLHRKMRAVARRGEKTRESKGGRD